MRFSARRRLCRGAFVLLCLLPTVFVAGAAVIVHTPPYRALRLTAWQSRLADRLGLDVQLASVEPQSGGTLILGIELRDPESHEWLVRIRSAEVTASDRMTCVELGQPEIRYDRLARLTQLLHERVLMRAGPREPVWQLEAPSLALRHDGQSPSLHNLQCVVDSRPEGTELLVAFTIAGQAADPRVRLRVVRNRQIDPPATGWELHTGSADLLCSLGTVWFPGLGNLGDQCTFRGSIWAEQGSDGWNADVAGTLREMDLDQLVTSQFPHKLSGMAELVMHGVRMHQGRVVKASGQLRCGGGAVSRSLLDAAERALQLQHHARAEDAPLLEYGQLALCFSLDDRNLTMSGPADSPATIMADTQGPLLSVNRSEPVSPVDVLRMLVPYNDVYVPATRETAGLFRTLPLPRIARSAARDARNTEYTPLRLRAQ